MHGNTIKFRETKTNMLMKLLVPTDFSNNAFRAMEYAAVMAEATGAELLLLHVYPAPLTRGEMPYALISQEISERRNEAEGKVNQLCLDLSASHKISCRKLVVMGESVEEIVNAVNDFRIDLVVMGTKGASGIKKVLFGSHAASVIEKARCPVWSIPENVTVALPKNVVFATNYQQGDIGTLKLLAQLVKKVHATLTILHVAKNAKEDRMERQLVEKFFKAAVESSGIREPDFHVLPYDDIQNGIELFVNATGADLIAMSTRKRSLFEKLFDASLTKRMAFTSKVSILAFHSPDEGELEREDSELAKLREQHLSAF